MRKAGASWMLSSILLAGSGILLIGVGIYFLVLRPPLLPEDIRVMGGCVTATGVLALTLALTSFRNHRAVAAAGAGLAGGLSIGLMAVVNFMIHSDFKWVLLGMALVWAASIAMFIRESAVVPKAAVEPSARP